MGFDAWHQSRKFGIAPTQPALNLSAAAVQGKEANIAKWQAPRMRRIRNPNLRPFIADIEPWDATRAGALCGDAVQHAAARETNRSAPPLPLEVPHKSFGYEYCSGRMSV